MRDQSRVALAVVATLFLGLPILLQAAPAEKNDSGYQGSWDVYDNFTNVDRNGDGDWVKAAGKWRVDKKNGLGSSSKGQSLTLASHPELQLFKAGVVRLEARLVKEQRPESSMRVIFAYQDEEHFRYVEIRKARTGRTIVIGQVGEFDGEMDGVKAMKEVLWRKNEWQSFNLRIYFSGVVKFGIDNSENYTFAEYDFPSAFPGKLGFETNNSKVNFRKFRAFRIPDPPLFPGNTGYSLRLMNYNVAMLATGDTNEDIYGMDDEDRAVKIAAGILRAGVDVVTLNEVFAEDGRSELVSQLSSVYPHYVRKLDKNDVDEDSGLMLFSRFPFIPLTNQVNIANNLEAISNGVWGQVAFVEYADASYPDSYANKGCGLVRIQNPYTSEKFTVVFTHLQASYGKDDISEKKERQLNRWLQMRTCRVMMEETLTSDELANQQLFMLGDLNINGNPNNQNPDIAYGIGTEWQHHFDVAQYNDGSFYACGNVADNQCPGPKVNGVSANLVDTWAYETSPADIGRTTGANLVFHDDNESSGERLDYILRNKPDQVATRISICNQHLSVVWEVGEDNQTQHYSDHLPVRIDMNRWAPYCNPLSSKVATFSSSAANFIHSGGIASPGSMQWLKINQAGTYSFAVTMNADHIGFDVYAATDLSRPYKSFHEETSRYGIKYNFTDPPYYVRVYAVNPGTGASDRSWVGPYRLKIHQHQCRTAVDACAIFAGEKKEYPWPSGQAIAPNDTLWYSFYTDVSDKGVSPLLKYYLDRSSNATAFSLELADAGTPGYPQIAFDAPPTWQNSNQLYAESKSLKGAPVGAKKYFIKVHRLSPTTGVSTVLRFTTNLTYFLPIRLRCSVQNDTLGDDEIWTFLETDISPADVPMKLTGAFSYFGSFDEGSTYGAAKLGVRKYVQRLGFSMIEEDEGLNGANDWLYPRSTGFVEGPSWLTIRTLDEGSVPVTSSYLWADENDSDDADYWYELHFRLMHEIR